MDSESHSVSNASSSKEENKITDYFSSSFTEEDLAALDDDWNGELDDETNGNQAKKRKI